MDIKELEYLKEFKKFSKIKYIVIKTPYFEDFISLRPFSPGTYD